MKRTLLLLSLATAILYYTPTSAQATETTATIEKVKHPAYSENYSYSSDDVAGAILARLKKDGINAKSKKGVITATGVRYPAISAEPVDLYFQVSGRGRKDKDGATVTMFVSKGQDNFVGRSQDATVSHKALRYLDDLRQDITTYSLTRQVAEQQKTVDKQTSTYKKHLKTSQKLESKRYSLQKDISGEMDPSKQDKLKSKLQKLNRDISDKQLDVQQSQRDLQRQKDQLSLLQDQLARQPKR
jgi:hypothetical protein